MKYQSMKIWSDKNDLLHQSQSKEKKKLLNIKRFLDLFYEIKLLK